MGVAVIAARAVAGTQPFVPEAFRDHRGELVHRLARVRALRHEHDLVAQRGLEREQGRHAARIGKAITELQTDLAFECPRRAAEHRGRPCMQAIRVGKNDRLGSHRRPGLRLRRSRPGAVQGQCQHRRLAHGRRARPVNRIRNPLAVRNNHLGQQAFRIRRDVVQIELDQRRARLHLVSNLHLWRESLALQRNRVDPHVHQHFHVAGRLKRHRVHGCVLLNDLARTRGAQNVVRRINRNSVAGKLLREDRIGHAFERIDYAGDRRQEGKLAVTHGD